MSNYDARVDAYIAKSPDFAQPVLNHVRTLVHEVCPETIETLKWGMPHFEYKGLMCGFAAFKNHCSFGFWKTALLQDPHGVLKGHESTAMGSFGKLLSLKDLPSDKILKALIKDAMRLNDDGIKVAMGSRKSGSIKDDISEPDYFTKALSEDAEAAATWKHFAPSHRREYLEWITEAKTEATRTKRVIKTLELLREKKQRHWKYQ